jgi:hypothetical protein
MFISPQPEKSRWLLLMVPAVDMITHQGHVATTERTHSAPWVSKEICAMRVIALARLTYKSKQDGPEAHQVKT